MDLISFNFSWMSFNIFLALIPVFTGWVFYMATNKYIRYITGIIWFFFVPNSLYLFTDIINLIYQWQFGILADRIVFLFQYSVLIFIGFITYILSIYPIERYFIIKKINIWTLNPSKIIILINFIIGFGITLGRVTRVNSWDVIYNPLSVISATITVILSLKLIGLTILFGLFANLLYFSFRDIVIKYFNHYHRLSAEKQ